MKTCPVHQISLKPLLTDGYCPICEAARTLPDAPTIDEMGFRLGDRVIYLGGWPGHKGYSLEDRGVPPGTVLVISGWEELADAVSRVGKVGDQLIMLEEENDKRVLKALHACPAKYLRKVL